MDYPNFETEEEELEFQRQNAPFELDAALRKHLDFFGARETRDFIVWWFARNNVCPTDNVVEPKII